MTSHAITVEERFWSKVDPFTCVGKDCGCHQGIGHCWPWSASIKKTGYGQFGMIVNNKWTMVHTHRVSFELTYRLLSPGMHCCHHCDYRPCCRPDHLFEGTRQDNMDDAVSKGRIHNPSKGQKIGPNPQKGLPGERHPEAKVTAAIIQAIREADPSIPQRILATRYDVDQTSISRMQRGEAWKHVDIPTQHRGKGFTSGDRHWSHQHPERVMKGENHPMRLHPELRSYGDKNPMSKLTTQEVHNIRALKGQKTGKALAEQFHVSPALISLILNDKIRIHIP